VPSHTPPNAITSIQVHPTPPSSKQLIRLTAPASQHVPPQQVEEEGHICPELHICWPGGTHVFLRHWLFPPQHRPPHAVSPEAQHVLPSAQN